MKPKTEEKMLGEFDGNLLQSLKSAEMTVTETGNQRVAIRLANFSGEVSLGEGGLVYGPHGAQKVWDVGYGDCTGAFTWAVAETKRMIRAEADALIARLEAAV